MKIIAYTVEVAKNRILLEDSTGAKEDFSDVVELLNWLSVSFDEPVLRVCWNLDATIAPLLRLLGEENCKKLLKTNKCFCRPYSIFHIPKKIFSIKPVYRHERTNFYDLEQYFPDKEAPRNARAIALLGEELMLSLAMMNLYPTKLTSPVAIWEQCVMNHLDLPTVYNMPQEAALYAHLCSGKLWCEAFQIGYWE